MNACLPFSITLRSTYHSPRTVNRNAVELIIGTVRLSSAATHTHKVRSDHIVKPDRQRIQTMLPNQQKKPHAPRQIYYQGDEIRRRPEEIHNGPEQCFYLHLQPSSPPSSTLGCFRPGLSLTRLLLLLLLLLLRFIPLIEIDSRATDKRRRKAPCDADKEETEDVVECAGGGFGRGSGVGVHGYKKKLGIKEAGLLRMGSRAYSVVLVVYVCWMEDDEVGRGPIFTWR